MTVVKFGSERPRAARSVPDTVWSLLNVAHASADAPTHEIELAGLPNAARVVARWFPAGKRGPAQGVVTTSTLIGGAVTPMLMAYLIQLVGWRWAFVLFGLLGLAWAWAFYRWYR